MNWQSRPLEECIERVKYDTKIPRSQFLEAGAYPIVSQEADFINGYWDKSADLFKVDRPVVIFGDHTQVLKYVDFDFVIGADGVKVLKPKPFLDAKYFCYYLRSIRLRRLGYARHYRLLAKISVNYPSLSEQRRIVAILDEAFTGIDTAVANTEKNLANARELFKSHLNSVFAEQKRGWAISPLEDCLQLITYGFTNPMPTTDAGPYMVTAKNVVGGQIDYASARYTSRDAFENLLTDKSRPKVGDVLLTKDGTLGRVAAVDRSDICINQSVALLRPNGRIEPNFMRYLLSASDYQKRMVGEADGATIKHIYITRVDKMRVAFPASLPEQHRIVRQLDSFAEETRGLQANYQQKLDNLANLRQAILQKAFAGELTAHPEKALPEAAE